MGHTKSIQDCALGKGTQCLKFRSVGYFPNFDSKTLLSRVCTNNSPLNPKADQAMNSLDIIKEMDLVLHPSTQVDAVFLKWLAEVNELAILLSVLFSV